MRWIRQRPDWPRFTWDEAEIAPLEADFRLAAERSLGAAWHLDDEERQELRVEFLTDEAVDTSAIEGEILDRHSVRSPIRERFGWKGKQRRPTPEETGAADLMVALYSDFDRSLDLAMLCDWHRRLLRGRSDLPEIGAFRRGDQPMQVVSGPAAVVHYEAPPSARVPAEMERFVRWYEKSAAEELAPLTWAGLAHPRFRLRPSLRGRQRTHRPRPGGKGAGARPRPPEPDRAFPRDRPPPPRLLRSPPTGEPFLRHHPVAAVVRRDRGGGPAPERTPRHLFGGAGADVPTTG